MTISHPSSPTFPRWYVCTGDPECMHNAGYEGGECPLHEDERRRAFLAAATTPEGTQ